jgi:hypothetical protein
MSKIGFRKRRRGTAKQIGKPFPVMEKKKLPQKIIGVIRPMVRIHDSAIFPDPNIASYDEIDLTVWGKRSNIIAGGIDSSWTKKYTKKALREQMKKLLVAYKSDGASNVTATSRYDGHVIADAWYPVRR